MNNIFILDKEFLDYCKLNKIPDVEKLARETFNKGFTILKYGETPSGGFGFLKSREQIQEELESKTLPIAIRPAGRPIDKTEVVIIDPPHKISPVVVGNTEKKDLYDE